ncbi:MAG: ribosomal-protein-serine acetyltransferase [Actinomycetota bacterium]|jgi:ribosomal-protein-serine acetyltransferase|nr:ribosomal-protein-serine acetyltransferase [Actinomycetota bacterium]
MERRPIGTSRLSLVPSAIEHARSLWEAVEVSLPELTPWMPWASDDSYEHNRDFLKMCQEAWQRSEAWTFTIMFEGRAAGTVGLSGLQPLIASAELGYWLRTDLAGRGLMTEAAAAVVAFGFGEAGLHRIELHAGVANTGSIRVAEKVGFKRMGMLRDASCGKAGWYDCHVFDLLESDERPSRTVTVAE